MLQRPKDDPAPAAPGSQRRGPSVVLTKDSGTTKSGTTTNRVAGTRLTKTRLTKTRLTKVAGPSAEAAPRTTRLRKLIRPGRATPPPAVAQPAGTNLVKDGGKGRPTPKRSEAQARNRRPLVPSDRKGAAKAAREAAREERAKMQLALTTGDERHMPFRDRGPQKRLVRDIVDSRRNVGEYFLIIAGGSLLVSFFTTALQSATLIGLTTVLVYGMLAVVIIDSVLLSRRVKRAVTERFGAPDSGVVMYGWTRALQMRRLRRPIPMIKRGEPPR